MSRGLLERRPVPRWVGVAALASVLALNELTLEHAVVPDGEIGSAALRGLLLACDLAAAAFGLWVLLLRPRSRVPWNRLALAGAGAVLAWFAAFAVIDTQAPGLLRGTGIRYFELRARYRPDPELVMVPRRAGREERYLFRGDLHDPDDDVPDPALDYRASYNDLGFRTNSADPPWDAVVVGDSFVEFGESDSTTVSEMLRRTTGLATFNLGRGWYGPHQYVEVLRRHGLDLEPRFAVLFFFGGNDPEDAREYEAWRDGGSYYHFSRAAGPLWERFATATLDALSFLQWETARLLGVRRRLARLMGAAEVDGAGLAGRVEVAGDTVAMRFGYWAAGGTGGPDALLGTGRWEAVRRALRRFRDICRAHGVTPVVAFVPTKATTYARQIVEIPERFRGRAPAEGGPPARARALAAVADDLGVAHLDLTEELRAEASGRPLLFYRQDTHWTRRGRRVAAEAVGSFMRERWPEATGSGGS